MLCNPARHTCAGSDPVVIYSGKQTRPHGQVVKTAPSHGAISGSNPLGVTSL